MLYFFFSPLKGGKRTIVHPPSGESGGNLHENKEKTKLSFFIIIYFFINKKSSCLVMIMNISKYTRSLHINLKNMTNLTRTQFQSHPYHMVEPSPWPLLTSFAVLTMTVSAALWFNGIQHADILLTLGFLSTLSAFILWFRDIITEGTYLGDHTFAVQKGITMGVALFILSEAFFFVSIFWAYFHSALAPTVELGSHWPPAGIEALNPFAIPLTKHYSTSFKWCNCYICSPRIN